MPIYPRGDSFLVSVGSGANRVRVTAATQAEAEAKEKELLAGAKTAAIQRIAQKAKGDPAKTLQDAYDAALRDDWKDSKGVRTTTLNARHWLTLLGADTPLVAVTTSKIDEAVADLLDTCITNATVNRKLAALSVMLRRARRKTWLIDLPTLERKKETGGRVYWYTEEDEQEMLEACRRLGMPELADFIVWSIDTGFRRSESLRAKPEDLGGEFLMTYDTKNGGNRAVPATDNVRRIVESAQQTGKRRVFDGLTDAILRARWSHLREYLGKSDDPKYIVHVLRHTTATRLAQAGATAQDIMHYMGHSSIQTSMLYIHMVPTRLRQVANLLNRSGAATGGLKLVAGGAG